MHITLWYSQNIKQWRWTLVDTSQRSTKHEAGQRPDLRDAMSDITTTIEFMVAKRQYVGQDDSYK